MPGSASSRATASSHDVPTGISSPPAAANRASSRIVFARERGMPIAHSSSRSAAASASGVAVARSRPSNGVVTATPNRRATRPAIVDAPATLICWPSTPRSASSKRSSAPGIRNPGAAATSSASSGSSARWPSIRSGSASRSSISRSRASIGISTGSSDADSVATSTFAGPRAAAFGAVTDSHPSTRSPRTVHETVRR